MKSAETIQLLEEWIRKQTPPGRKILIPVSGGTDSGLCFFLYNRVLPEDTLGVFFGEHLRARSWFESVGTVRQLPAPQGPDPELSRFYELMLLSRSERRMLIGTRNRTEDILGTYSLASRLALQFPLAGMWKSDILALCEAVGVPEEVIASSRNTDPVCGRPEELAQIPFAAVDAFVKRKIGEGTATPELEANQLAYLEAIYARNEFKRNAPVIGPLI